MTRVKQTIRRWRRIRAEKARLTSTETVSLTMHADDPRTMTSDEDILVDSSIPGVSPVRIRPT